MYDIIFIGSKTSPQWLKIKSKFSTAKQADSFAIAQKKAFTKMFYTVYDDVEISEDWNFSYKVPEWDEKYIHSFLNGNDYDGISLHPKKHVPTSRELDYRFFVDKKEVNIVASKPKSYDIFEIDSYEEYQEALEHSTTDMFWMTSRNIDTSNFNFDIYFTHYNSYDKMQNHAFIHKVGDKELYNGVFLCSKKTPLSKREVDYRFPVNRKEWDLVASGPKTYDVFEIDTYEDYCAALEQTTTEMFWMTSANLDTSEFNFDIYFTHDNEYDRKQNHAFIHRENGKDYYNGVFLCSKHVPLSAKEVNYRFPVNRKEWDVVASTPAKYDVFEIDTWEEYEHALANARTEMFWMSSVNIDTTDFAFDVHFTHDNEYDRKQNHAFIHRVKDKDYYNGVFLCSKSVPLSKKEVEHRFPVNRKEWNIVASKPVKYDIFEIETYDDYKKAVTDSKTEMFWMTSANIDTTKFKFDVYFTHDNEYDRKQNHAFIHKVDGENYYNGVFLCSKHVLLSEKEVNFRFPVNKKEWDIVASYPKKYDIFEIETYDDYVNASVSSSTEMFWIVFKDVDSTGFDFSAYFTHDNKYDRNINHTFLHDDSGELLRNGVWLCSKNVLLSKKEVEYRFIVNAKEHDIVASKRKLYDKFIISSYEDYLSAHEKSTTQMFWAIHNDLDVVDESIFETYFTSKHMHDETNAYDLSINHVYKNGNYNDGIILCSKKTTISKREWDYGFIVNKKENNIKASVPKPFDIIFISYKEFNADENYADLLQRFPNAKRVHGVKGIHQAHIAAANLANTDMFWVVDGDAELVDSFNFAYQVPRWEHDMVHVWRTKNPVTGMEYGYGGVKLLPKQLTLGVDVNSTDMTTSISSKFKAVSEVSNITKFNTDAFSTWRSAFRECVKLTLNNDEESKERLEAWLHPVPDAQFRQDAKRGAEEGKEYALNNIENIEALNNINNFEWLREQFNVSS